MHFLSQSLNFFPAQNKSKQNIDSMPKYDWNDRMSESALKFFTKENEDRSSKWDKLLAM